MNERWIVVRRVPYSQDPTITEAETVEAFRMDIEGGALVFRDGAGKVVRAFGPSYWLDVDPEPADG